MGFKPLYYLVIKAVAAPIETFTTKNNSSKIFIPLHADIGMSAAALDQIFAEMKHDGAPLDEILAIGGNERAARLSGVPVAAVKRWVYAISGLCAGIAGLVVVSINSSSDANLVGLGMELDAIAAVAVGGTPFTGGQATVVGTLIGALLIQLVRYTLLANGVPDAAALVVKGAIIAGAVWSQQRGRSA